MGNTKLNDTDFKILIDKLTSKSDNVIENFDIELNDSITIDISDKTLLFKKCNFKGARIDFHQDDSKILKQIDLSNVKKHKEHKIFLNFENCTISNDLVIKDCLLRGIVFSNVKITSKIFHITSSSINEISFCGNSNIYNLIDNLVIHNIEDNKTFLDFRLNKIKNFTISNAFISESWINKNEIEVIKIDNSVFDKNFDWFASNINQRSSVLKSQFNNIEIKQTIFDLGIEFKDSVFKGKAVFESPSNLNKCQLSFLNVNFESQVSFEKSSVSFLKFESVSFKELVSFQSVKCEYIKLDKIHFDKVGFFNDLSIQSPQKCSLSTIRTIKNQLNKTENKIDYLKFNAIEMNLLIKDKNTSTSDLALLILNKNSNDYGTNWTKGIWFTFKNSLFFFVVLLIVNNFLKSKYPLSINIKNEFADFGFTLNYFLKFVFNLGLNDTEIQSNGWLYLIFIFAKLLIGYGIYQTIQAFRKYGK